MRFWAMMRVVPHRLFWATRRQALLLAGPRTVCGVTLNPLAACGHCRACGEGRDNLCPDRQIISMPPREGGFAQYVAIPEANIVTVPDEFSLEKASLAEPIACGWHAVRLAQEALDRTLSACAVSGDWRRGHRCWCPPCHCARPVPPKSQCLSPIKFAGTICCNTPTLPWWIPLR